MKRQPFVIAEIGCNHKGDMDVAHEMIKIAANFCRVDAVKFQKRNPKELLTEAEFKAPHPNPANSYGATYGEHRTYLELDIKQNIQLQKWCEEENIQYSTSIWDLTSAKEIVEISPPFIKIPSACNLNFEMLEYICKNFDGEIHISFGMTTIEEQEMVVKYLEKYNKAKDTILYSCTSGYPVAFEDVCLLEINRLKELYGNRVKDIGFSGHHLGIAVDVAAFTLGANTIERHFTLDRTWKGTDHAASLEPDGMRKLVRNIKATDKALSYKKTDLLDVEKVQREKLKRISLRN